VACHWYSAHSICVRSLRQASYYDNFQSVVVNTTNHLLLLCRRMFHTHSLTLSLSLRLHIQERKRERRTKIYEKNEERKRERVCVCVCGDLSHRLFLLKMEKKRGFFLWNYVTRNWLKKNKNESNNNNMSSLKDLRKMFQYRFSSFWLLYEFE